MATSIKYLNYVVHINDNGIVTLSKDGVLFRNQTAGSRELASVLHLDIEPDFRRKKINRLIIQEIARLNGTPIPELNDNDNDEDESAETAPAKSTIISDNATSQTPTFYQKRYQAMYGVDLFDVIWDKIIPENAAEMLGALMFCKAHKTNSEAIRTLRRLMELCRLYYADDNEINRFLPSVKQTLKEYEITEAKEQKKEESKELRKKIFIWIWVALCVILIIVQAIFWGLWTLLSGAVTVVIFGGVLLLCEFFIWE